METRREPQISRLLSGWNDCPSLKMNVGKKETVELVDEDERPELSKFSLILTRFASSLGCIAIHSHAFEFTIVKEISGSASTMARRWSFFHPLSTLNRY